jgi:pimeloyl-ACP methyl ester carboxylesterase
MQVTTTMFHSRQRRASNGKRVRLAELAGLTRYPMAAPNPERPPYPAEEITVNGVQINLRRTPSENPDAEPALYIHGLGGASTNFTDVADLLSPWFDGHAIDLPGFGRSGPPRNGDYSIAAHAGLVIAHLEQSGRGPVHLVGNSMGGAISIAVASSRPDLIRTLTLISPAVPDLKPKSGGDALLPLLLIPGIGSRALARLDRGSAEVRARAIINLCFAHPERVPANRMAESIAEVEARRGMPWAHDAMLSSLRGLVRTYLTAGQASPWRAMQRITAPSLVIWGELDKLVDVANAPRTARTIPDATLLVLPDIGHTAQLEDPAVTARAILALRERANDGFKRTGVGT